MNKVAVGEAENESYSLNSKRVTIDVEASYDFGTPTNHTQSLLVRNEKGDQPLTKSYRRSSVS
jgi:hypothetical protein